MFERILIATDGSELAQKAVRGGLLLAKDCGAEVIVITVMEPKETHSETLESEEEADQRLCYAIEEDEQIGVLVSTEAVTADDPYEAIVHTAERQQCDTIIMASHSRSLGALLLGSQTRKVLQATDIPVIVWHTADEAVR